MPTERIFQHVTRDGANRRDLALHTERPLILAGGLTPSNVATAIEVVRPAAVDVHTGVEGADGLKDSELVKRFVEQARLAFSLL